MSIKRLLKISKESILILTMGKNEENGMTFFFIKIRIRASENILFCNFYVQEKRFKYINIHSISYNHKLSGFFWNYENIVFTRKFVWVFHVLWKNQNEIFGWLNTFLFFLCFPATLKVILLLNIFNRPCRSSYHKSYASSLYYS